MTDLFQGSPLPDVTTNKTSQNIAPQYLTDYHQNIINQGNNAIQNGGVAGLSPLTQQAINMAPQTAFSGSTSAGTAQDLLTQAGYTGANQIVQNYMNPYTQNVVDEMARQSYKNTRQNVLPTLDAAAIGSGNFGSGRMANVTGQTLSDIQSDLLGKQYGALSSGYKDAMTAAQNDLTRGVQAGSALNNTATVQNNIGSSGLKTMADLGNLEQTNQQAQLDYPMQQAKAYASLMQGQNVPTGSQESTTTPGQAGQYGQSGLEQLATLAALYKAFQGGDLTALSTILNKPATTAKADGGSVTSGAPSGAVFYADDGTFYDGEGNELG
jgi:hypothetical protein